MAGKSSQTADGKADWNQGGTDTYGILGAGGGVLVGGVSPAGGSPSAGTDIVPMEVDLQGDRPLGINVSPAASEGKRMHQEAVQNRYEENRSQS